MGKKVEKEKNERTDNTNFRNGYYPERIVATEMGDISVREEIEMEKLIQI